jgi:glutamate/tyrosine decarboxylase-like PLP-dependent enzyme
MNASEKRLLDLLRRELESARERIPALRVTPVASVTEIRAHLRDRYRFEEGEPAEALFEDVARMLAAWTVHVTHPRYFGLFNPSVTLPSIVGDALTALYNPQLAAWSHAPGVNEIERHVLAFLATLAGFDSAGTHANFTTGGAEANHSAVLVALARQFPGFVEQGIGDEQPVIYVSPESHHSFLKIAAMSGIGLRALRTLGVGSDLRMDPSVLRAAVIEDRAAGRTPLLAVATAGTTSGGTIDPIDEIADVCEAEGLWLHVDAAWGGSYLFVDELAGAFTGIGRADSLTWDAHKAMSVPMGAGMFFCRHRDAVMRAFSVRTAYMPGEEEDTIDPYSSSVQWSRRSIGMKVFVSLAALGRGRYAAMLRHQVRIGEALRVKLRGRGWTIVNQTPLPVVCFAHPDLGDDASRYAALATGVQKRGRAWISSTLLAGTRPALRACITSFATTEEDLDVLVEEVEPAFRPDHPGHA